jgi:hypothetical protein
MSADDFSKTYAEARARFNDAAIAIDASLTSYPVDTDCGENLAIDVATLGEGGAPTVVVSSGVHGVEGFMGSAVQLALLERLRQRNQEPDMRYVLIHGVNPFGFSSLRRFNEENVDLNRNFLAAESEYRGAPEGYADQNGFLNPESPPSRFEPFKLKALWNIWRNGLQKLKQSVAGGQYDFPRGLFFGGRGPCKSTQIVFDNCDSWIGTSQRVVHIDFHSGLGAFGTYRLLLNLSSDSPDYCWYASAFGSECIEALTTQNDATAYRASGLFDEWMQNHFKSRDYRVACAEFGTFGVVRVLGAIRAENRAHHYGSEESAGYKSSKRELLECFCPQDASWREKVVNSGLKIIEQSAEALRMSSGSESG